MLGALKRQVFGEGEQPHQVWRGLASGCRFLIDPANKSQRIVGLDEAEIAPAFREGVLRAKTFIDVGASDGFYPIVALRLNPQLTAVGCEPGRHFVTRWAENYRLNFGPGNPTLEWVASEIGTGDGQRTLDDVASSRLGPLFIKIDVDGAEVDVLESGRTALARPDVSVLIEVHARDLERHSVALLEQAGFRCRPIDPAWWRRIVPEQRPIDWNRWVYAVK